MNKKLLWQIPACIVGLALFAVFLDILTLSGYQRLEPAVVRKVVPDARGFIGADEMTLVRFSDGFDTEVAGNRGQSGDTILAWRTRGTQSLFGIVGDRSAFYRDKRAALDDVIMYNNTIYETASVSSVSSP